MFCHAYGICQGTKWDEASQQEVPKLRCIDNGLSSGTNKATDTLETITTPSFLFPADVIHAMSVHCDKQDVHLPATMIGLDDLFAAYRRIPNSQPQFTTVAIYDHDVNDVLYYQINGHPFGLKASVVNFNWVPHAL